VSRGAAGIASSFDGHHERPFSTLTPEERLWWLDELIQLAAASVTAQVLAADAPPASTTTGAQPDVAALLRRIDQLEAKVSELLAPEEAWLTEERASQVRSLVQDVLADADSRASLQSSGMTAGWNNGFCLSSPDGNFRLNIGVLEQIRYIFNHQDDSPTGNDSQGGFENTRTRLDFSGHIIDKSWLYMVQGQFDDSGGTFTLLDAWVAKAFSENWIFLGGQYKVPVVREWTVDDPYQLAVNRSLINTRLSAGRTQGVALAYRSEMFRGVLSFNDGAQDTGGWNSAWNQQTTQYAFTGRADLKVAGDWKQYDQLTSFRDSEFGLFFGAGAHYQAGDSSGGNPQLDLFQWSVDGTAYFSGFNLFGSFTGRHLTDAIDADIYGLVLQGGFFLTENLERFGRYEWGDDDDLGPDDLNVATVGANWYVKKQSVKVTADFGYAFDGISPFWVQEDSGMFTGWRADSPGSDGQWVIRTQLQLFF